MNRYGYAAYATGGATVAALFCAVQVAAVQVGMPPFCGEWWHAVVAAIVGALFGAALWDERMRP